jgi:hypothetical protein
MDKLRMQRFKVALPQIDTVEASHDRKSIGFLLEASSPSLQHCGLKVTQNDILIYGHDVLHQRPRPTLNAEQSRCQRRISPSYAQRLWAESSSKTR